jgi:arsenate reductase (thioredoxin)
MIRPKVLFLCSRNSCRTQMAEAILREVAGDLYDVLSAGAEETPVDPDAVDAMREIGIEICDQTPKDVSRFLGERFSYVISLCDRQQERECPIFPGAIWRLQWDIVNPAISQSPQEHRKAVREARDQIREKVIEFLENH